jgi:hypothetical protein
VEDPIVAKPVDPLIQIPPDAASVKVEFCPVQTLVAEPEIGCNALTVTVV